MSHIIQTIHFVRSKYNNEVNFVIGGDVNKTDYSDVIDAYGTLKQCNFRHNFIRLVKLIPSPNHSGTITS